MPPQKKSRHEKGILKPGETDPVVIARRQKQIDYGKTTEGYQNYLRATPKEKRTPKQPRTPDKYQKCSRRSWDGQIKLWRLLMHAHDDDKNSTANNSVHSEMSELSEDVAESSMDCSDDSYNS